MSYGILYRIPVAGWFVRDAVLGPPDAKYYFIANLVALLAGLIWWIGYPLVICIGLTGTVLGLTGLVALTAIDLIDGLRKALRQRPQPHATNRAPRPR
jgi:hypothetical protein